MPGIDPAAVKQHAFGVCDGDSRDCRGGAYLVGPIEPFLPALPDRPRLCDPRLSPAWARFRRSGDRDHYRHRRSTLFASYLNPSWAPGVAFAVLLLRLTGTVPKGLFGGASMSKNSASFSR